MTSTANNVMPSVQINNAEAMSKWFYHAVLVDSVSCNPTMVEASCGKHEKTCLHML